jgi:hypothetical protein
MEAVVAELKVISRCFDGLRGTTHAAVSIISYSVSQPVSQSVSVAATIRTGHSPNTRSNRYYLSQILDQKRETRHYGVEV